MAPRKGEQTEEEKELVRVISKGNVQDAARLLGSKEVRVNSLDEHGMTPLMHAAYKGKLEMCRLLLQHGADVNCNEHEHGYTTLMFACLSGKKDIVWMMLEAGADTDAINSVGRTAAQMAAFVGQHDCVTVINNFFPREKLDYYTKPQGLGKEPKLPGKLAGPLHKIMTTTNLHPVKIIFLIKENPLLLDPEALKKCSSVLDLICERCMKQKDMNEVLAMKMHYISCILQKCISFLQEGQDKLDTLVKSLLKGRDGDCFPVFQEKFIRESIRKFPYCEATLLQQLVRSIAPVEMGADPTAFSVLTQAITGQVGFVDAEFCATCGEKGADKRCSVCKLVIYCGQDCQKLHWFTHKKVCKLLKEKREKQEQEDAREKRRQEKLAEKAKFEEASSVEGDGDKSEESAQEGSPSGERAAQEGSPSGERAAQEGSPSGERAAQEGSPSGERAAQEGSPSGERAGQEGSPSGERAAQEGSPSGERAAQEGSPSGERAGQEGSPSGERAGQEGSPSGERAAQEGSPSGERANKTDVSASTEDSAPDPSVPRPDMSEE